jgi:hypothetical protein
MKLVAIDEAIKNCKEHLDKMDTKNREIETYLTHYLLVFICRTYEKEIKKIIVDRAKQTKDEHIVSFIENTIQAYRCLKIEDLKGNILGKFNKSLEVAFYQKIKGTDAEIRYRNIILGRDAVAHDRPVNMTFDELVTSYPVSSIVLDALAETLS